MTKYELMFAIIAAMSNLVLAVVAVCAWLTARSHLKATRASNQTAQAANAAAAEAAAATSRQQEMDSRGQTRPYVSAEVVPSLLGDHSLDLRLTNTGRTAARGLTLTSEWPSIPDRATQQLKAMFSTPRDLAPHSSYRVVWRVQHDMRGPFEGMGISGEVRMHYGSDDPAAERYTDDLRFDFDTWGPVPLPTIPTSPRADTLENINLAIRGIGTNMAELRR